MSSGFTLKLFGSIDLRVFVVTTFLHTELLTLTDLVDLYNSLCVLLCCTLCNSATGTIVTPDEGRRHQRFSFSFLFL